ncbi:MAG: hypothetical protein RPU61_01375 [Candidatus Sedimenticola sp. (ex Thyasira tokunagai)]
MVNIFESINSSIFLMVLIITIFYIPLTLFMFKMMKQRRARVEFFRATKSILERVDKDDEAVKQIQIVYKKLTERYPYARNQYKSAPDFLEDYLCRIESFGNKRFKESYKFELNDPQKNRLVTIIEVFKSQQPYSTISSKYGNLLSMISHAFDTDNTDLGKTNLRQLSDDIEVLETTIEQQTKSNQISLVISVVGVILTVVFGALTVIQYVFPPVSGG